MNRIELPIEGMTCDHCVRTVTSALRGIAGVRSARVNLAERKAVVELDDGRPTRDELAAAVARAGYRVGESAHAPIVAASADAPTESPRQSKFAPAPAPTESLVLNVDGMTCASCVNRVESALAAVPGVHAARVNLATKQAAVEFEPARAKQTAMVEAIQRAGYSAQAAESSDQAGVEMAARRVRELSGWRQLLTTAVVLLVPIVALHFTHPGARWATWIQFVCATALEFYVGWPFLAGAARRARHWSTNMDTLIAIGTLAAWGAGTYELFAVDHGTQARPMYLMDAGTILTFITLGKYLEARSKGRASEAIQKLLDLAPATAHVQRDDQLLKIPASQVAVGETILVRPGEKVPLDAVVLSGQSSVDESWLTGESIAVDKSPGSEILAGTINESGSLEARVVRAAGQTALAQVVELVRRAQESKTDIQRLADRVVSWFVPLVLVIAAVTVTSWGLAAGDWFTGLECMVAVLVVACPCALGLATPTAILVASGRGAELGILIKEAHALEVAGRVTMVVLDKTGTVTLGEVELVGMEPAAGISDDELLATAAAAEQLSQHPLAESICAAARSRGLRLPPATDLELVPGQGIVARGADGALLVGNERLLQARGIDVAGHQAAIDARRAAGRSLLMVAHGQRYLGLIALADRVAPHSGVAIKGLKQKGLKIMLLSGDHWAVAERVAEELGIEQVTAELLPSEKQTTIAQLRAAGEVVAMVGDGINDAPALAAADLGIAIGSGSDIAIEAADIVIVGNDLRAVVRAVTLARMTLRTIRQNLAWAFLYNVILIPLAAGALAAWHDIRLPALAAAAAMALSSVSVVTNSLLLRARTIE